MVELTLCITLSTCFDEFKDVMQFDLGDELEVFHGSFLSQSDRIGGGAMIITDVDNFE